TRAPMVWMVQGMRAIRGSPVGQQQQVCMVQPAASIHPSPAIYALTHPSAITHLHNE
ncbi:unnamed protein product, partial [Closterium sp. Yama58-4]